MVEKKIKQTLRHLCILIAMKQDEKMKSTLKLLQTKCAFVEPTFLTMTTMLQFNEYHCLYTPKVEGACTSLRNISLCY